MTENSPPICYEKFSARNPNGAARYNNFITFFRTENPNGKGRGLISMFKDSPTFRAYQKFQKNCPDLDEMLCQEVGTRDALEITRTSEDLDIFFYAAYVIMRTNYGASDEELIGGA